MEGHPDKYDWTYKSEEGAYTLTIKNPTTAEEGTYNLVIRELDNMKTGAYVAVKAADPEYCFKKFLKDKEKGLTARPLKLVAHLNVADAPLKATKWLKNGSPLQVVWLCQVLKSIFDLQIFQYPADGRIQRVDKGEKLTLVFRVCELDDTGTYSVEITEFVKNGEKDQTDCWLEVEGRYVYLNLLILV